MKKLLLMAMMVTAGCIPAGDSQEFGGGPDEDTGTISDAANDASTNDAGGDTEQDAPPSDATVDEGTPDMGADTSESDMACVPNDDALVCMSLSFQCGAARGMDNCGATRDLNCGQCSPGAGCASAKCLETECRDNNDNDGDGDIDCADSDCLNQACDANNPMKTCSANGQCN